MTAGVHGVHSDDMEKTAENEDYGTERVGDLARILLSHGYNHTEYRHGLAISLAGVYDADFKPVYPKLQEGTTP